MGRDRCNQTPLGRGHQEWARQRAAPMRKK